MENELEGEAELASVMSDVRARAEEWLGAGNYATLIGCGEGVDTTRIARIIERASITNYRVLQLSDTEQQHSIVMEFEYIEH